MIIAFLVFNAISVLKIAVEGGFVVGITAAIMPSGFAIFLIQMCIRDSNYTLLHYQIHRF